MTQPGGGCKAFKKEPGSPSIAAEIEAPEEVTLME
jgi:hypothetical protein